MPPRDLRAYLSDIRISISEIEMNVAGLDFDTYCGVRQIRMSVEREFMIIGEALRQMLDVEPNLTTRITAASDIIAFRNHLAHGYFLIADATVWDIIQGHLPKLKAEIKQLIAENP
ncbi:MAG: DUF86 domain-containing protein [Phycisphaerales bacterium]|nr:DUF86 domain-containing protein [Phycisphaerales bacterium]